MAASNPPKAFLNSKLTLNTVAEFKLGYKNARNKEMFLKNYETESRGNPSIDEKIEDCCFHRSPDW